MPRSRKRPGTVATRFLADRGRVLALSVGLAATALYLPSLAGGLVWDDVEYVLGAGGKHLVPALTGDLIQGSNPAHGPSGYWRPLPVATFLAVKVLGNAPWLHHLASALLHGLGAALLLLLLVRRTRPSGAPLRLGPLLPAAAAAVLWAFHPAQSETVAWISARYDLMAGVLAAALFLLPARPGLRHPLALALVFLAGLLSKEAFAAVSLAVVADDWGARRGFSEAWPRWLAVVAALATWLTLRAVLGIPPVVTPRLGDAPGQMLATLAREAVRAVAPLPLTVGHPVDPPGAGALLAGAAVLLALLALALRVRRLAAPAALFAGPLVLAGVAIASLGEAPERYFYLPSLGLAWLLAEGLAAVARRWPRAGLALAGAAGIAALGGAVAVSLRLPDWRSEEALFGAAVRVDPDDATANVWLGLNAARAGHLEEAHERLERAVRSRPDSPRPAAALAWVHLRRGDTPAALEAARRAVALGPSNPQARLYLSGALHLAGDHAAELAEATRAEALSPALREARIARALARCEVEGPGCDDDLDRLYLSGLLVGADLLAARAEAAIRFRDGVAAIDRVGRLRDSFPGDPRLRLLGPAAARLSPQPGPP